jgi:HSP20 family protein
MEELMQGVWSEAGAGAGTGNGHGIPWVPAVDIEETEDGWIVEAELPGVDKKDINVELRDSELTITGDIKERERTGILRRRTRRKGRFEYRVALPGDADADGVDASLHDGVLTLRVPKSERAKPRRIDVKAS